MSESTTSFGTLFSQVLSKGIDTASAYATSSLAIKSAEAQAKAANKATQTVTSPGYAAAQPSAAPKWLPWAIGGGIALLGLIGLGMLFRR